MSTTSTLTVCAVLLGVSSVLSQGATYSISGTILDKSGKGLRGATVTVVNLDTGDRRELIAGDRGRYDAADLSAGTYQIRVQMAGFQSDVRRGIQLNEASRTAVVDMTLIPDASGGPAMSVVTPLATPGERLVVTLRLENLGTRSVRGLKSELEFPGVLLHFVEARPAKPQNQLSVKATVGAPDGPRQTTRLSVVAESTRAIAVGDVADLVFDVSKTATDESQGAVTAQSAVLRAADGQEITNLTLQAGIVRIKSPLTAFSCFFYMH